MVETYPVQVSAQFLIVEHGKGGFLDGHFVDVQSCLIKHEILVQLFRQFE